MKMKAEFSKETIDEIFSTMTVKELSQVEEVFFSCDSNPDSPRYLYISTAWPRIAGWNEKRWIPLKTNDLYDFKKVEEEKEKARIVQKYYYEHRKELKPVISTCDGQILVEEATGVVGGSINLFFHYEKTHSLVWFTQEERARQTNDTIRAFLLFASALNNRDGGEDEGEIQISFKTFDFKDSGVKVAPPSRIKIVIGSMNIEKLFLKIHQILSTDPSLPPFYFTHKTLVATYLSRAVRRKFETFFAGYTGNIEEMVKEMRDARANCSQISDGSSIEKFNESL